MYIINCIYLKKVVIGLKGHFYICSYLLIDVYFFKIFKNVIVTKELYQLKVSNLKLII